MCQKFKKLLHNVQSLVATNSGKTLLRIWSIIFDILKIPASYITCKLEKLITKTWQAKKDSKIQVSVSKMLKSNMKLINMKLYNEIESVF